MAVQFEEIIKDNTYEQLKRWYNLPALQRKVYDALLDLTPSTLGFILAHDFPKISFNHVRLDQNTHYIICCVMKDLLDNTPNLLLTRDDLYCCWGRFKELIFLHEAVKQGIIMERADKKTGASTYWTDAIKASPDFRIPKNFIRVRNRVRADYGLAKWVNKK